MVAALGGWIPTGVLDEMFVHIPNTPLCFVHMVFDIIRHVIILHVVRFFMVMYLFYH